MERYDLVILGAGVGGYVAALRAAQLGRKVLLVEKSETLGGTCLNVGCIPSKALLESSELYAQAQHRFAEHGIGVAGLTLDLKTLLERKVAVVRQLTDGVAGLMKKQRVTVLQGEGRVLGTGRVAVRVAAGEEQEFAAEAIALALGSRPVELPFLRFDGTRVVSSTEALAFETVPQHLVVVGAGAVGLELGSVWSRLGATVTVVERMPQILPFADRQLAGSLQRSLEAQGLSFRLKTELLGAEESATGLQLRLKDAKGQESTLDCDRVLVAVGRRPNSEGLSELGIELTDRGHVRVDRRFETSLPGVYALGDLIEGPMLAHKAEEDGVALAEILAGLPAPSHAPQIPNVVYTAPELASVGLSEAEAKEAGLKVKVGRFLFRANGRALSMGETEGLVRILAAADDDRLLGVTIVGPRASELIAEAVLALEMGASAEDLARTVHAHPTLSEAVKEAALDVDRRALHA